MTKLKGVVVGCGAIAREHIDAVADLDTASIAAVCDISPARAESTAERFGIKRWFSNLSEMLTTIRPDLVHVTTPPASHFPIAENCLASGINVLCEKPLTINYQDFLQLKQLAVKNKCLLIENQNYRFHSSIKRIQDLRRAHQFGDVVDLQISIAVDVISPSSPYNDHNAPHFSATLPGGVIGDFLPHVAYIVQMFTGRTLDLRTRWSRRSESHLFPADEFHALVIGENATACVAFSGSAQPNGFWIKVTGSRIQAEANLFESPTFSLRRARNGERSVMTLLDGIAEARDVGQGSIRGFWRKLGGKTSYDGLPEFIARTYRHLAGDGDAPVSLEEIDDCARLVQNFTESGFKL